MVRLMLIPLAAAVLFLAGELIVTYPRGYTPPPRPTPDLVEAPDADVLPAAPTPEPARARRLEPAIARGTMAVDTLHFNFFLQGELEPLLSRVTGRGYGLEFFGDRLALGQLEPGKREPRLEEALRGADAYLVVSPILPYSEGETELVRRFLGKGGRVLFLSDPTRLVRSNSLASALGINFESDYLYNVARHESNYRNVYLSDFARDEVTSGLGRVALYTAGSITGEASPLARAGAGTRSSTRRARGGLAPMVRAFDGDLVALSDVTFMTSPYNAAADNPRLLDNLARFLTSGERRFTLADLPHFFDERVDVVATAPELVAAATSLKGVLSAGERDAELVRTASPAVDTAFLATSKGRRRVGHLLRAAGITFSGGRVRTPYGPPLPREGSGIVLLEQREGRDVLLLLADTPANLETLVRLVRTGGFRDGLVSANTGLYRLAVEAPSGEDGREAGETPGQQLPEPPLPPLPPGFAAGSGSHPTPEPDGEG